MLLFLYIMAKCKRTIEWELFKKTLDKGIRNQFNLYSITMGDKMKISSSIKLSLYEHHFSSVPPIPIGPTTIVAVE